MIIARRAVETKAKEKRIASGSARPEGLLRAPMPSQLCKFSLRKRGPKQENANGGRTELGGKCVSALQRLLPRSAECRPENCWGIERAALHVQGHHGHEYCLHCCGRGPRPIIRGPATNNVLRSDSLPSAAQCDHSSAAISRAKLNPNGTPCAANRRPGLRNKSMPRTKKSKMAMQYKTHEIS